MWGPTPGDTQCKGLVWCPEAKGHVLKLPHHPWEPLDTSLSLQHSCLDGREDRPAVPLANTQARKSYQKATVYKNRK